MKSDKMKLEDFVKETLENYEAPYDPSAWESLAERLPKGKSGFFNKPAGKIAAFIAGVAITALTIYLLTNQNNTQLSNTSPQQSVSAVQEKPTTTDNSQINNFNSRENSEEKLVATNAGVQNNQNVEAISSAAANKTKQSEDASKSKTSGTSLPSFIIEKAENILKNTNPESSAAKILQTVVRDYRRSGMEDITFNIQSITDCEPASVMFVPTIIADSITYLWDFGDGTTSREKTPVHIYNSQGVYEIKMQAYARTPKNGRVVGKTFTVKQSPKAQFEISANDDRSFSFINLSSFATSVRWDFGDKNTSVDFNAAHTYYESGKFIVKLVALHANGCADSTTKEVNVKAKEELFLPTAFVPNGDGINDFFAPTGPALNDITDFKMLIYSRSGQVVFESNDVLHKWDGTSNGKKCEPGVYVWTIVYKTADGRTEQRKGTVNLLR